MDAYATDKLISHVDAFAKYKQTGEGELITVHLMPQNTCNQRCSFCAYRMPFNQNSDAFDEGAHLSRAELDELLSHFKELGVQGIEVTGGGEPLAYPHQQLLWDGLLERGFATALVTNGTLMKDWAPLICSTRLKWARVSIDAATPQTYQKIRKCPPDHFEKAWRAVDQLRRNEQGDPEFRLGVGFVACPENLDEVWGFVKQAKESGADNVRLSSIFSSHGAEVYDLGQEYDAEQAAEHAKEEFEDESFAVHNLLGNRVLENRRTIQDYPTCPTKDFLCVVEGEGKVYTCCTFTGSEKGCYGKFQDHPGGFKGLWTSTEEWRRSLDPRKYCRTSCLYRERNLAVIEMLTPKLHKEFI